MVFCDLQLGDKKGHFEPTKKMVHVLFHQLFSRSGGASRCIWVRRICGVFSKKKMLYVCDFDQLHGEVKKQSIFSDSRLDRNHPPVSFFVRVFKSVNWVMQIISYTDTLYLCHLRCALLVSHVILQCCHPVIFFVSISPSQCPTPPIMNDELRSQADGCLL